MKNRVRQPCQVRDHVGCLHVLRHSGAIARLQVSGNPKSVQEQLRHKSAQMTLRYLKTIGHDEAMRGEDKCSCLAINKAFDLGGGDE